MPANITIITPGRRAWPASGAGGTLRLDGGGPGKFYRAAASGTLAAPIGLAAHDADKEYGDCTLDEFAVWRATLAVQTELKERGFYTSTVDGIWGSQTDTAVRAFQRTIGLTADGIYGQGTSRALWISDVRETARSIASSHADLTQIAVGTIAVESAWDPGAVGSDPGDLGLCQINGIAHPSMSVHDRLNPKMALPYMCRLILKNLDAMKGNTRDAVASYNLGVTGARNWIAAGRPDLWKSRNVKDYIDKILSAGLSG